jgi:glycine dehydrogenase subunit 1
MEDLSSLSRKTHASGGLFIVSVDPIALGMFSPPGDYDADIVTGECQPLGIPLSFGGPYTGLLACKKQYLRQMPGRIVGCTTDQQNRKGYVLTLQTREQHIRREKATSNICTSESLMSLTAAIYLATLGKQGLRQIAEACYHKSHYTASLIGKIPGYRLPLGSTFFQEFVVECPKSPREINHQLLKAGILGGLDISSIISNGMLFCVTEMNTAEEIHKLVKTLQSI